jgi:hypothetical protein
MGAHRRSLVLLGRVSIGHAILVIDSQPPMI